MLLAEKKKAENISEYIIYMYQTELLIRNFELDLEKVKLHVIGNIPDDKVDKKVLTDWYEKVIADMNSEGLQNDGHLSYVQAEVNALSELSLQLLTENEEYQQVFNAARPSIRALIMASEGKVTNPVQACLNGVFGFLLARMNNNPIDDEQQEWAEHFGNVLSYLNYHHGNPK